MRSKVSMMIKEQRKSPRQPNGATARIRPDEGFYVRPCVVSDMSTTGVQLTVQTPGMVSDRFILLLPHGSASGRRCPVRWRKGSQIGAEFAGG